MAGRERLRYGSYFYYNTAVILFDGTFNPQFHGKHREVIIIQNNYRTKFDILLTVHLNIFILILTNLMH